MKHTIHRLALSNIRQNKSRSVLMILSIFLTTLLLAAIAGVGCGMVRNNQVNAGNLFGNYVATLSRVKEDQYEMLKLRSEFTNVGRTAFVAEVDSGKAGIDIGLSFMDITAAENKNFIHALKAGILPKAENEIVASAEFFEKFGLLNAKPGDHVSIPLRRDSQSKFEEKEFIVSGVVKSPQTGTVQKSFQGFVSQKFYESLYTKEMRAYEVTLRMSEALMEAGVDCEEVLWEVAGLCGVEKDNISPNRQYLMWMYDPGTETIFGCILVALLVIVVSVSVIYNIFQVGMVQKIQEYGKIKALGATRKQMKKLILQEGMLLAVIGVPLGLPVGCGVAFLMCRVLITGSQTMAGVELTEVSVISLPLLIIVALSAFLTVRLALSHPMRVAAKTSPVEAMRYQENTSRGKGVRKGRKRISVFGMTLSNMLANRRRTISTICTMGLSCVLFVSLSNLAGNIDNKFEARRNVEYGQFSIELDYRLNDTAYPENNLCQIQKNNPLGEEFQEKMKAIPGVTEVKSRKCFEVENISLDSMDADGAYTTISVLDREGFERYGKGSVLGIVNYDEVAAADGILYGYSHFMEDYGYEIGQQIQMKDMTGSGSVFEGEIMGAFGSAPGAWVITQDTFDKLGITEDLTNIVWVDCEQKDKTSVKEAIEELVAGMEYVETDSYDRALKQSQYTSRIMQSGVYMFLGLLGVIGFLNMANTIITGAVTRKRELGVLQAVGMTNRQLNWMMQLEGIFFSAGTAAVSLLIGSPLGYVLFSYAKEKHFYGLNEYHFPLKEISLMILAIVLLQASLSFLLSRNLRKESLVERIVYQG